MADPSLNSQAIEVLDQALRERDPLTRMMLMERALNLHRAALQSAREDETEAREASRERSGRDHDRPRATR